MRRRNFLAVTLLAGALCFSVASCSKSKEQLIKEYNKTAEEAVEAVHNKDMKKFVELCNKSTKILDELETKDLTPEDRAQLDMSFLELPREMGRTFSEEDFQK